MIEETSPPNNPNDLPVAHLCRSRNKVLPWSRFLCSSCRAQDGIDYTLGELVGQINADLDKVLIAIKHLTVTVKERAKLAEVMAEKSAKIDPSMTAEYAASFALALIKSLQGEPPEEIKNEPDIWKKPESWHKSFQNLSPNCRAVVHALIRCNSDEVDELAMILAPRIVYGLAVNEDNPTDQEKSHGFYRAVMAILDLKGCP
jgi:hypothetical protein